jgi:hypothetical protein
MLSLPDRSRSHSGLSFNLTLNVIKGSEALLIPFYREFLVSGSPYFERLLTSNAKPKRCSKKRKNYKQEEADDLSVLEQPSFLKAYLDFDLGSHVSIDVFKSFLESFRPHHTRHLLVTHLNVAEWLTLANQCEVHHLTIYLLDEIKLFITNDVFFQKPDEFQSSLDSIVYLYHVLHTLKFTATRFMVGNYLHNKKLIERLNESKHFECCVTRDIIFDLISKDKIVSEYSNPKLILPRIGKWYGIKDLWGKVCLVEILEIYRNQIRVQYLGWAPPWITWISLSTKTTLYLINSKTKYEVALGKSVAHILDYGYRNKKIAID